MNEQNNTPTDDPSAEETVAAEAEAAAPPAPEPTIEERLAALEAEVLDYKDRWLRSEAEMQNLRARTQREIADARSYATQKFARDVVEAAENLRRGLESLPPAAADESELLAKLRGGFESVEKSFVSILERNGVTRVEAEGEPFDPEMHQAMAEQPAPEGVAPGTVVKAWTSVWLLRGRLLKPAMVIVAK